MTPKKPSILQNLTIDRTLPLEASTTFLRAVRSSLLLAASSMLFLVASMDLTRFQATVRKMERIFLFPDWISRSIRSAPPTASRTLQQEIFRVATPTWLSTALLYSMMRPSPTGRAKGQTPTAKGRSMLTSTRVEELH